MTQFKVGLFETCLVNSMRPGVTRAAKKLLEFAGCEIIIPKNQTCCGQPAWNSGYLEQTKALAKKVAREFIDCDYVVLPSGSCGGMMRKQYKLVQKDETYLDDFSEKCWELTSFLFDVCHVQLPKAAEKKRFTYHDSCGGLRELAIKKQPRALLKQCGHEIIEMKGSEQCCGFGGSFSNKYGEISSALADDKCQNITKSGCTTVVLGDVGCMLNIEGKMLYNNQEIEVVHVAEILAEAIA